MTRNKWQTVGLAALLACSGSSGTKGPAPAGGDRDPATIGDAQTPLPGDAARPDAAVDPTPGFGPGPWDKGWPVPKEDQDEGDPKLGRELLLGGSYMSCGVPYTLLSWMGVDAFLGLFGSGAAGETIPREGKAKDLPYMLSVFTATNGAEVAMANCLMCHGGHFNGELVLGLGAADQDFTGGPGGPLEGFGALPGETISSFLPILNAAEQEHLAKLVSRAGAASGVKMRTVGNNPAEMQAVLLVAHHDPKTLAWSDEVLQPVKVVDHQGKEIENPIVTSDPPPWWRTHKKNALFYNAMARGDHRGTMALASTMCVDTIEEAKHVDGVMLHVQSYLKTLRAPKYPFPIDQPLANKGAGLFATHCAGCHGIYGQDDEREWFPNLLIPLDEIGTDPVVAEAGSVHAPHMVDWYNESFYGQITRMVPDDPFPGYLAPPLDGVWATGPFLHNGSVPTIELVLNSKARPKSWRRVDLDSKNFDQQALGFPFKPLTFGQNDAPFGEDVKMIYDTSFLSQSNAGHIYGDVLSDDERRAVLEYLKTL